MKRLTQINRQLASCCTSALKAHRKRPLSASRTLNQQWQDFQALISKSRVFDAQALREMPGDSPEVKLLLKLVQMQGTLSGILP
jgi:hypothetical protein